MKCKNNGSQGRENDRSSDDAVNGLKQENVGIEMAAGEDMIHKKKMIDHRKMMPMVQKKRTLVVKWQMVKK